MTIPVAPQLDRRRFLIGSAAVGVATGLTPGSLFEVARAQAQPVRAADWDQLARNLVGPLLRPGDSPFPRFVAPYNLAYNDRKLWANGIALCANAADIATAIGWARDNKVPLVARSSGHSYAGYSMTPGLMIDLTAMRGATWDAARRCVTVTGGVRNSDVTAFLRKVDRTITHGRCPMVGTAGFLLGGGIGFNMRLHGVGIDHLRASEIVTAAGDTLALSAQENPDLF
jgi:FAD/FMN-containing dehydrogenase